MSVGAIDHALDSTRSYGIRGRESAPRREMEEGRVDPADQLGSFGLPSTAVGRESPARGQSPANSSAAAVSPAYL